MDQNLYANSDISNQKTPDEMDIGNIKGLEAEVEYLKGDLVNVGSLQKNDSFGNENFEYL